MPAHIKASLVGFTVSVPITNHRLNLGIWQGIYVSTVRIPEQWWQTQPNSHPLLLRIPCGSVRAIA